MYQNKLNRQWTPCKICKWGSDNTTLEEFNEHCNVCNELCSEWEESNEFRQFQIGVKIAKVAKQIEDYNRLCRLYPVIIMGFPGQAIDKLLSMKEESAKRGLEIIKISTLDELKQYIDKYYYHQLVLCTPHTEEFRDFIYHTKWIMQNCKVFTCFPEFGNKVWTVKETKKDILDLKLDRRFDQLALKDNEDLCDKLNIMGCLPNHSFVDINGRVYI